MKKTILGILLLSSTVFAQPAVPAGKFQWPSSPVQLRLISVIIDCEWKDGVPWALRKDVFKILHIPEDGSNTVNLSEVLAEKGWQLRVDQKGIQALNPNGASSVSKAPVNEAARAKNANAAGEFAAQKAAEDEADRMRPHLVGVAQKYIADTEYIRAVAIVKNIGGSTSESCTAVGEFCDWYEHKFAECPMPCGPLKPGESIEFTFFSLIHKDDQNPNGVIKADKYKCNVVFRPLK